MADTRDAGNNIYTILAFIAFLTLLIGVGYVVWRHYQVYGGNPFDLSQAAASLTTHVTALI